jgi:transposase-like protein
MSQYALERKESVVRRMLGPIEISIPELARETGISEATLYNWRNQAGTKGEAMTEKHKNPGKGSSAQKLAVVVETFSFNEAELAEYCRKKGLYPEQVNAWREACKAANAKPCGRDPALQAELKTSRKRNRELERELTRKEKALAETAALLTLRKKADAIWGEEKDA